MISEGWVASGVEQSRFKSIRFASRSNTETLPVPKGANPSRRVISAIAEARDSSLEVDIKGRIRNSLAPRLMANIQEFLHDAGQGSRVIWHSKRVV